MKKFSIIFGFTAVLLFPKVASAQTVTWKLSPENDYTSISLFVNDLFKVAKGPKVGIINAEGQEIVPTAATEITGFYEGKALVLCYSGDRSQILGFLSNNGQYVALDKNYYALDGMYFFSEGLLPAQDEKGRKGYLDTNGRAALGFRGKYDEIHPFTEGMAAVYSEEEFTLIDRQGTEALILTGGEIGEGTNLYNGMAYVADAFEDVFYAWNKSKSSSQCKKIKAPKSMNLDYLYCFSEVTGRPAHVPYEQLASVQPDFEPFSENGRYGFQHNGTTILPCQFESASAVVKGVSVVKQNGRYGILQILEQNEGFSASAPSEPFKYIQGKPIDCHFFLNIPTEWQSHPLQVSATDISTGELLTITDNGQNKYQFATIPTSAQKEYKVSVNSGALELWQGTLSMQFKKRQVELQTSLEILGLQSNTAKADADDKVIVRAIVTNPGNEIVKAVITMKGSEAFRTKTESVQIPAHGKVVVESYFVVKENLENQYVKVTTDNGAGTTQYSLRLKTVDDIGN